MKQKETHYCFQQEAGSHVHQLYIYDDVTEYGDFNWSTWEWEESETSANYFRKTLEEIPEGDTIELHINSCGGSVKEGVAIYNQLKQKKCKEIVAYVDGYAYSIASVILQAADRRIMGVGTSLLIHNMWLSVAGNAEYLRKAADDLDVLMESNRQIYLERAKVSEEELIEMMNAETYLTPEQAVEKGFADEVSSRKETDPSQAVEALQREMKQLRTQLSQQQSFRQELRQLAKATQQKEKDTGSSGSKETDGAADDNTTGEETNGEAGADGAQEKNEIVVLLAKAAAKNLEV